MYRQAVILNTLMIASLVTVLVGALARFAPSWQPALVIGALAIVAVEAGIIHHVYRRDKLWTNELLRYLAPELLLMAVLMRFATSLSLGQPLFDPSWLRDPARVLDVPFLLTFLAGIMVGTVTHNAMQGIRELLPRESERLTNDDSARVMQFIAQDRAEALRGVSNRFITGGAVILLALGLESVNIGQLFGPANPISNRSTGGALLYVISGFLFYSQARLALLNTRWQLDGAVVSPEVARRWGRSSILIIVGVAGLTALLPRTYALGLLDTLRAGLGIIGYVFALLGYAVIWLFSLIALIPALLLALLSGSMEGNSPPPVASPPPPPLPPAATGEPNLPAALVFWACMALLVVYALVTMAQRHPLLVERILLRGPIRKLWFWLRSLWHDTTTWLTLATTAALERLQRPVPPSPAPGPRGRLNALAPRELVRYFYRSTLRRAAQGGLPRQPAQTPREYRDALAQAMPDTETDIAALTEAFQAAQYSPRDIPREDALRARTPWQRLRARLRGKTR